MNALMGLNSLSANWFRNSKMNGINKVILSLNSLSANWFRN